MKIILLVGFLSCYVSGFSDAQDPPKVSTPLGVVQGYFKKSYYNRTYSAFEGIPYAVAPVGDLRFSEPKPAVGWQGTLYADKTYNCLCYLPFPVIHGPSGTEDCLYLYVYVPRETIDANENLDVVVHIHGGAFMYGSPSMLAGPDYIMDKDVVFVTMNYRLGVLGFLSTEDDVVPGNNGLKDQALALRWIKDNIKYFGGNPDSVTLTGLSAGGSSVHFHYFSPLSRGLFHRGFSQSGTALLPWALPENLLDRAKLLADFLNCSTSSTEAMVECLKGIEEKQLVSGLEAVYVYKNSVPFILFGPVIEKGADAFIDEHPYKMLENGQVYDVPWICSNTKDEGIFPVGFFVLLHLLGEIDEQWNELMPYMLDYNSTVDEDDKMWITKKIRDFYIQDKPLTLENTYDLVKMFTDRLFIIDSEKSVRLQAKVVKSPIYYSLFEYILQQSFLIATGKDMKKGSAHGDDGRLFLKVFGNPEILNEEDEKMMNLYTEFIENYAKTGKPIFNNVEWKPLDGQSQDIDYLDIVSPDYVKMKKTKELGPNEFWESLPIQENDKLFV